MEEKNCCYLLERNCENCGYYFDSQEEEFYNRTREYDSEED